MSWLCVNAISTGLDADISVSLKRTIHKVNSQLAAILTQGLNEDYTQQVIHPGDGSL